MNEYPETTERTLADLRSEFGADTIEHYKAIAQTLVDDLNASNRDLKFHANRADRWEKSTSETNVKRNQDLENFKQALFDLLEEDSESVEWEKLVRPLSTYLDIELERKWRATVTVTATVYFNAMTREKADEILDGFYSGEVGFSNRDFEDYEIEDIEHKDLNADN
jgi:hypothetical protein